MSNNVVALSSKRKPIANITAEPVTNKMPKTIKGPWGAALDENFIVPDDFVGWMDVLTLRDGIGKIWDDEADDEDDTTIAVVLNNVCRRDTSGNIRWRMDRRKIVLEVLNVFKKKAYIEFHPGYSGISIVVNGEAAQAGRGFGMYRWVEILDYRSGKPLPLSGNKLTSWSVDEPTEFQGGLDWFHERFMVMDEFPDVEEELVNNIVDILAEERNRLINNVEGGHSIPAALTDEQQLAVYQTLFELLDSIEWFPYSLLDGFTEGE